MAGLLPALLLLACAGDTPVDESVPATMPAAAEPVPGNPAPDWSSRSLDGTTLSLADYRGQVVLLNIWATWCAPCLREMPALQELQDEFGSQGLTVIGASIDRGSARGQVEQFIGEQQIGFRILLDPDQTVMEAFRAIGVPESILIDREGTIRHRWLGEFDPHAPEERARIVQVVEAGQAPY